MTHHDKDDANRASDWKSAEANAVQAEQQARLAARRGAPADEVDALQRQARQLRLLANEMHDTVLLSLRARAAPSRSSTD